MDPFNLMKEIQELITRGMDRDNPKAVQNILSALRGPDFYNDEPLSVSSVALKWFTTARIRAIVAPSYCGDVNPNPLGHMDLKTLKCWIHKRNIITQHFINHYYSAVSGIRSLYGYDLLTESKVITPDIPSPAGVLTHDIQP